MDNWKNQRFEYIIYKHNPDWITGGPLYNTSICKNYMEHCLKIYIINARNDRYFHFFY